MPSALTAGLDKINAVAAEGDLDVAGGEELALELDVGEPVMVPDLIDADGQIRHKAIYPPRLHGDPVHEVACRLLDMQCPERLRFLKLTGPPGTGKSRGGRLIAHHLWTARGRAVEIRHAVLRVRRDAARTLQRRVLLSLRLRPGGERR